MEDRTLQYTEDQNITENFFEEQDGRKPKSQIIKGQTMENFPTINTTSFWSSKRFLVTMLIFFGWFNLVILKVNLNISIVEMTSKKEIIVGNITKNESEFDWDSKTIGMILSMHSYGYLTCLGAGYVISKFGGAVTYGSIILIMAIMNLITPVCLRLDFYLFLGTRLIIGVLDGFGYAGCMEILSRWAPVKERSRMLGLSFCGIYIGIAASYPTCGFLAQKWGWPSTFYAAGIIAIVWYIFWQTLVKNQPSKDKRISKKELQYIMENTETTSRKHIVHPYWEIITSFRVWALCVGEFAYSWGFTLLVTSFPLYIKDITGRNIEEVGFIALIPNIACMFMIPIAGFIMDFWQNNSTLTRTQIHKIMMGAGFLSGSLCLGIAAYSTSFLLSMACFILIKLMLSFNYLILQLVCLSMSPKHSSVLAGISAFWFTVSSILIPTTVGFIVQNHSLAEWNICFLLSSAVLFFGAVVFFMFGSSELQSWSKPSAGDLEEKFDTEISKARLT